MSFDVKKLFESAYKKNKFVTIAVVYGLIIISGEVIIAGFYNTIRIIHSMNAMVEEHSYMLEDIEERMAKYDVFIKDTVKITRFDEHVKRKDDEYRDQNNFDMALSSKVGVLEGSISILSNILGNAEPENVENR